MIRQFIRDTALAAMLLTGVFTTAAAATCTIHLRIAQSGQHPISFNVSQV
jgi:hypothetical protein